MLVVAVTEPAAFFGRAVSVTPALPQGRVDLPEQWLRTVLMFVADGDSNPRHNVANLPLLGWPVFLVAALGVLELWRRRRHGPHALVLLSLPLFMLPPLIATEGDASHFLRSLGLAAPLAVTIGLGFSAIVRRARRVWGRPGARLATTASVLLLVALAIAGGRAYFSRPPADRYWAYRYDLVAIAERARPGDTVILDDYNANVVRFLDADALPRIVPPGTLVRPSTAGSRVLARSQAELAQAIGPALASRAAIVGADPGGQPTVWAVTLP
jgi:hypothetical protein